MPEITQNIDYKKSALLVMDHQELLLNNYVPDRNTYLTDLAALLEATRARSIQIVYVTVGFRKDYPEVSDRNAIFTSVRDGGRFLFGDSDSAIPASISPQDNDLVILKHRVSAFESTELQLLMRARDISTIILLGITTSGVVLSTVRQAADLDYKILVLGDYCFDPDPEVQTILLEKILPMQASVTNSSEYLELLNER